MNVVLKKVTMCMFADSKKDSLILILTLLSRRESVKTWPNADLAAVEIVIWRFLISRRWQSILTYLRFVSDLEAGSVDHTIDLVADFIKARALEASAASSRGPFLAQLELIRILKERGCEKWREVLG